MILILYIVATILWNFCDITNYVSDTDYVIVTNYVNDTDYVSKNVLKPPCHFNGKVV